MTKQDTQIIGDEGAALAGALAPSSRSGTRRREPVIQVFRQERRAARFALADETSPVEGFESIGEVSVRLLALWKLPSCKLGRPKPRG